MKHRNMFLIFFLSALIFTGACGIERIREKETDVAPESTTVERREETTVAPTPEPTAKPVPRPTQLPSPTPETVYIPPKTLPGGQLFEDEYYLILPGEGAIYNVFDCKGEIVKTYHAMAYGTIGLFEKEQAERIIQYAEKREWNPYEYDPETGEVIYKEEFPGGYLQYTSPDEEEYCRIVTEKETIRFNKDDPDTYLNNYGTTPLFDRTAVCVILSRHIEAGVKSQDVCDVFYMEIEKDGTVVSQRNLKDLPGRPVQLIGDDIMILEELVQDWNVVWNLTDLSGNILIEDVGPIMLDPVAGISFYDYYLKDGIAYDENMHPVPDETLTADGCMIPGVTYLIEGIPCTLLNEENYNGTEFFWWAPIDIAIGEDDDNIAIKTEWGDCVIHGTKAAVRDVNSSFVLLDDLSVYSFKTGEFLFDVRVEDTNFDPPSCSLAEDYIIVRYARDDSYYYRCYVIDNDGNLRYYSEKSWINTTDGPYLFLERGPYVGLSDLGGEWILKTLNWNLTNDGAVFWRYWG